MSFWLSHYHGGPLEQGPCLMTFKVWARLSSDMLRTLTYSPKAATAASNPSSSSPGISLFQLRLGGREPVGETTGRKLGYVRQTEVSWEKTKGREPKTLLIPDPPMKLPDGFFLRESCPCLRVSRPPLAVESGTVPGAQRTSKMKLANMRGKTGR